MANPANPAAAQDDSRLSQISTNRDLLARVNRNSQRAVPALLLRYQKAASRYLRRILPDRVDEEEVWHQIVLRVLEGELADWDPDGGERFRDFFKKLLLREARPFRKHEPEQLLPGGPGPWEPPGPAPDGDDSLWWRTALINKARRALWFYQHVHRRRGNRKGNVFYTVFEIWRKDPGRPMAQVAAALSQRTGRPFTEVNTRKQLSRARKLFALLLVAEVWLPHRHWTYERLQAELGELKLLAYVRGRLSRGDWTREQLRNELQALRLLNRYRQYF
jgi:hypothetical protein